MRLALRSRCLAARQSNAAVRLTRPAIVLMRWSPIWLLMIAGLLERSPRLRAEEPFRMAPALAGQLGRVDCQVVGGRIKLTAQHIGGQMSSTFRGSGRVQESFTLDLTTVWPRLDYQASASTFEIRVAASAGEQVAIQREPSQGTETAQVGFIQRPEGSVEFTWRKAQESIALEGRTLWHVWLAEPELCTNELLPLLKLLRPSWDLDKQAISVERALLAAAEQDWTARWPRWTELVAQLDDDQFTRRRAADRALRSAGMSVVPFLQNLEIARLEPEQRSRVRRIVANLQRFNDEDTPDRAALWLAGDPSIWLTLMARDDVSLRRIAAGELAEILGRSIEFDPAGELDLRAGQLAKLKAEVLQPVAAKPTADLGS